ncbi:MAG: glycosyltransferase family 1 protein [Parcubacteria group bacterium]
MILGIDASRANVPQRTGTEWYAYFLIKNFFEIIPYDISVRLYIKSELKSDFGIIPPNVKTKVLAWPPKFLWSQLRLSGEMAILRPDMLFVPAHTIPYIHPRNTVTTLHDVGFERFPEAYSSSPITDHPSGTAVMTNALIQLFSFGKYANSELDYHRFSARFAISHARRILTVSEFSKREIVALFKANPEKISVIPNGYDHTIFSPNRSQDEEMKIQQKIGSGGEYVVSVGRLEFKKNTARMVEAFATVKKRLNAKNLKFVLIGAQGYGYDKVLEVIKRNNLSNSVLTPGWLDMHSYVHLLRGAKIFFFASIYEGFGIPLLEAMACGVPILTSEISSMPEICGTSALYCNPFNAEDLARKLELLLRDQQLRRALIEKGYVQVQQFSWKRCARETLEILRQEWEHVPVGGT